MKTIVISDDIKYPEKLFNDSSSFMVSYQENDSTVYYKAVGLLEREDKLYAIISDDPLLGLRDFDLKEVNIEDNRVVTSKKSYGKFHWIYINMLGIISIAADTFELGIKKVHTFKSPLECMEFILNRRVSHD